MEEGIDKCSCIVIDGGLMNKYQQQDMKHSRPNYFTLKKWLKKPYIIFSRTSPAQKLDIVKACQNQGEIVGLIGKLLPRLI